LTSAGLPVGFIGSEFRQQAGEDFEPKVFFIPQAVGPALEDADLVVEPFLITDARRLPNGKFTLTFAGEFGMAYVVECSTNSSLTGWLPLKTNFVDSLGNLEFTDSMATNRVRGFYRVKGQ
jgi:hypothetical protein